MIFYPKSIINLNQFEATIWEKYNTMEQTCPNYVFGLRDEEILKKNTDDTEKCNQCDYASSQASHFRRHLKTHSGEKTNKCNQCDYASSRAGDLRQHLKTHSGEKSNKCNHFAFSQAGHLRTHLKTHSGDRTMSTI